MKQFGLKSPAGIVLLLTWLLFGMYYVKMIKNNPRERGLPDFDDEIHLEKRIESDPRSQLSLVLNNRILWSVALVYFYFVSDILSRKLSATGMGFLTTFTSIAGIITTPLSGKSSICSTLMQPFSFAVMELAGAFLTLCIRENAIYKNK